MNAHLTRDQQIDLMRDPAQRIEAHVNGWLRDRVIRRAFSKPAPGQDTGTRHTRQSVKLLKYGQPR